MSMSRRQRTRTVRGVQYGLLALVVAAAAFGANWGEIRRAFFDVDVAKAQFPEIITTALVNTVVYTLLGFGFGLALGLILALMRLSSVPPYRWLAIGYIEFFRGVPALLVFIALGFGVPIAFQVVINQYVTVMLALGLVGAAYMAETIRAGIQAVPKGQVEAARSLGMSQGRAMRSIVIPQAFRIVLPPLTQPLACARREPMRSVRRTPRARRRDASSRTPAGRRSCEAECRGTAGTGDRRRARRCRVL